MAGVVNYVAEACARMLGRLYTDQRTHLTRSRVVAAHDTPWTPAEQYALLERYYSGLGLYDAEARLAEVTDEPVTAIRSLRTPAFQVVEYHVATVWPGRLSDALKIEMIEPAEKNEKFVPAINRVWEWSNWDQKREVHVRMTAIHGDGFLKVVGDRARGRVYFEVLKAGQVTEIDADERGYLTYCRIDVPNPGRVPNIQLGKVYTEIWSKDLQTRRTWTYDAPVRPLEELGIPDEEVSFAVLFGGDFVPIVHTKFRDVGDDRGASAYLFQLPVIDELNLKSTRMSQQLFADNDETWVLTSTGVDREGRPMPALRPGPDGIAGLTAAQVRVGKKRLVSLPGGYDLKSMVPDIDYASALAAQDRDAAHLKHDLPEMAYWEVPEIQGDPSGRALEVKLLPAVQRTISVRGTFDQGLVRANQMAATIGQSLNLEGFREADIGLYEARMFDHKFKARPVIPVDDLEKWTAETAKWTSAGLQKDAGVDTATVLEERDYSHETIAEIQTRKEADQSAMNDALGTLLDRAPGATVPVNGNGRPPQNGQQANA